MSLVSTTAARVEAKPVATEGIAVAVAGTSGTSGTTGESANSGVAGANAGINTDAAKPRSMVLIAAGTRAIVKENWKRANWPIYSRDRGDMCDLCPYYSNCLC